MTMGFTKRRPEEETMMKEWLRTACCGIILWGCAGSLACAPVTPPPPPPTTPGFHLDIPERLGKVGRSHENDTTVTERRLGHIDHP